ncbi:hypothetical protein KQI88_12565 [Alkaliphilus sp. MSJ-5]|uniref:Uncharacterized protein n=1 Tax=Alkaliphilus flagellatus TaxID=2841507 RepID=A0ABS6G424_9FIRM|nr:hypothetical protein [Alkaliphilus flagellatus]MBU5677241.1 hypothetical protein [Alkaliphilus flagellatus]MBU5677246.1 hypothetical protein [Alkaliphilus flagellatus]
MKRKITLLLSIMMLLSFTLSVHATPEIEEPNNINLDFEVKENGIYPNALCLFHDWYSVKDGDTYREYTKREKQHCYDLYQDYKKVCMKCGKNDTSRERVSRADHKWKVVESGTKLMVQCQICGLAKDGW